MDLRGREVKAELVIWGLSIWNKRGQSRRHRLGITKTRSLAVDVLSLRCLLDSRTEVFSRSLDLGVRSKEKAQAQDVNTQRWRCQGGANQEVKERAV